MNQYSEIKSNAQFNRAKVNPSNKSFGISGEVLNVKESVDAVATANESLGQLFNRLVALSI